MLPKRPLGNPRNSKSPIELSLERELDVLVKVSISLQSEFDAENQFSVILVKVSISLQSEFDPEGAESLICGDLQPADPVNPQASPAPPSQGSTHFIRTFGIEPFDQLQSR